MKKLVLLGFLVAATASAQPYYGHPYDRDYDRHVDEGRGNFDQRLAQWQPLMQAPATGQVQRIRLDPRFENLRGLRFEARRGHPVIDRVELRFADGSRRDIEVNRALDRHEQGVIVPLGRRMAPVREVLVFTQPSRGSYAVYGTD